MAERGSPPTGRRRDPVPGPVPCHDQCGSSSSTIEANRVHQTSCSTAIRWRAISAGPHSPARHGLALCGRCGSGEGRREAAEGLEQLVSAHARGLLVDQVRGEPALRLGERHALPGRVVGQLVATDPADPEVVAVRVPQVVAGDRGARPHRERLGQPDAGPRLRLEQVEQRRLLGVVRAGRIAGRRADALVALGDEVGVRERLVGRVAPQLAPDALVEPLGEGLGQAVGEGLGEDRRVVVVGRLELGHDLVEADARSSPRRRRCSRRRRSRAGRRSRPARCSAGRRAWPSAGGGSGRSPAAPAARRRTRP